MLPAIKYSCLRVGGAGKEERSACVYVWENGEEDFKKKDVGLSLYTSKLISTGCVPTTSIALTGGQSSSRSKQGVFDVVLRRSATRCNIQGPTNAEQIRGRWQHQTAERTHLQIFALVCTLFGNPHSDRTLGLRLLQLSSHAANPRNNLTLPITPCHHRPTSAANSCTCTHTSTASPSRSTHQFASARVHNRLCINISKIGQLDFFCPI